jgi:hypothetical protein
MFIKLNNQAIKNHHKIKLKRQKEAKNASKNAIVTLPVTKRYRDRFEKSLLKMSIKSISLLLATN